LLRRFKNFVPVTTPPPITLLGNPVLRARAAEIADTGSSEVAALSANLHAAMLEIGLVGLATPCHLLCERWGTQPLGGYFSAIFTIP
jgi:hypothetical protein